MADDHLHYGFADPAIGTVAVAVSAAGYRWGVGRKRRLLALETAA